LGVFDGTSEIRIKTKVQTLAIAETLSLTIPEVLEASITRRGDEFDINFESTVTAHWKRFGCRVAGLSTEVKRITVRLDWMVDGYLEIKA